MSLRAVNLNLVPVLQALLRERSVSRAAIRLGLSQSAASEALAKLRATLGDPLLVRLGGRTELTEKAEALTVPVEALCADLEAFFSTQAFDPSVARRTFVIAASDYAIFMLAERLLMTLEREAPAIQLRFVGVTDGLTRDLLERATDFALIPSFFVEELAPTPLRYRSLFQDEAIAMFRTGHPLSELDTVTESDLARFRMISFHPGADTIDRKRANIYTGGMPFDVAGAVPQVTLSPFLLVNTDYAAIGPRRMAERMAQILPLQIRPLTFSSSTLDLGLAWSPIHDSDRGHRWFRETAERVLKDIQTR